MWDVDGADWSNWTAELVVRDATIHDDWGDDWGTAPAAEEDAVDDWGSAPAAEDAAASDRWGLEPLAEDEVRSSDGWDVVTDTREAEVYDGCGSASVAANADVLDSWESAPVAEDADVSEWGEPVIPSCDVADESRERPATTIVVARRLVFAHLGEDMNPEQKAEEHAFWARRAEPQARHIAAQPPQPHERGERAAEAPVAAPQSSTASATPSLDAEIDRLFSQIQLAEKAAEAKLWAEEMGAISLDEILENAGDLGESIGLKPLEQRRLLRTCSDWAKPG